jgi:hypothetical protein
MFKNTRSLPEWSTSQCSTLRVCTQSYSQILTNLKKYLIKNTLAYLPRCQEPKKNKKFYCIEATRVWLADCAKAEPKKVSVLPRFHLKTTFFRQKSFKILTIFVKLCSGVTLHLRR